MANMASASPIYVVPRWAGRPASDWYPWLTQELAERGRAIHTLDLPAPDCPVIADWAAGIAGAVGRDPVRLADTYVIGHSVGCQAVVHWLASLPEGAQVAGVLLVASWFDIDEPWDTIVPWIEARPDWRRARAAAARIDVLLSDNDPFTADWQATRRAWQERLGAEVAVAPGGKHFNQAQEPAVLSAVTALLGLESGAGQ
jgi:hypothetical protein